MKKILKSNMLAGLLVFLCFLFLILDTVIIKTADFYATPADNICEWISIGIIIFLIIRNAYVQVIVDD